MSTVAEIDRLISAVAPKSLSESWDNDGVMLCESTEKPVKKILIMLEVTPDGAAFAAANGYDLIVTHHPLIFRPLGRITDNDFALLQTLMAAGISVLSYHTRMDAAQGGVNDTAAELLGLRDVQPFGGENGMAGRIGALAEPLAPLDFAEFLKERFGCQTVRASLFRSSARRIEKVAFIGGAGKSFFAEAYAAGADAFVTGEAAHNTFIDCTTLDMCLFECGHYHTENPVCRRFKELLDTEITGIQADIFDVGAPFVTF